MILQTHTAQHDKHTPDVKSDQLLVEAGRRRHLAHRARDERGEINVFAVMIALIVVVMLGLVVDGSSRISAAQEATAIARQAARAGGQQISVSVAASGRGATTNKAAATAAAHRYLREAGATGDITVNGDQITVTATVQWRPVFLRVLASPVSGRSTAVVVTSGGGGR